MGLNAPSRVASRSFTAKTPSNRFTLVELSIGQHDFQGQFQFAISSPYAALPTSHMPQCDYSVYYAKRHLDTLLDSYVKRVSRFAWPRVPWRAEEVPVGLGIIKVSAIRA